VQVFKLAQAALVRQVYVQGQRPSPRCLLALADLSACYGGDPRVVLRCSLRAAASCSRFFAVQVRDDTMPKILVLTLRLPPKTPWCV
jgi:hypothetical protein